jgi:hypothetical protein
MKEDTNMKTLKIMLMLLLSVVALNANAFQHYGYHDHDRSHEYHDRGIHGHQEFHGYRNYRNNYIPWVIGGALLYGATVINYNQNMVNENGVMYQRVDTYCIDPYGRQYICGYEWVQR